MLAHVGKHGIQDLVIETGCGGIVEVNFHRKRMGAPILYPASQYSHPIFEAAKAAPTELRHRPWKNWSLRVPATLKEN